MLCNQTGGSNFLSEHAVVCLIGRNWFFLLKLQENPRRNMVVRQGRGWLGCALTGEGFGSPPLSPKLSRSSSSPATAPSPCAGNTPRRHSDPPAFLVSGSELQAPPWGLPVSPHVWPATPCCRLIRVCTPGPQFPLPSPARADFPCS